MHGVSSGYALHSSRQVHCIRGVVNPPVVATVSQGSSSCKDLFHVSAAPNIESLCPVLALAEKSRQSGAKKLDRQSGAKKLDSLLPWPSSTHCLGCSNRAGFEGIISTRLVRLVLVQVCLSCNQFEGDKGC